ncbi:ABC transporter permease [candidate division KSB1 bacterium]|nr:ABC transporter permease [candidate division KSB1 bacterium]
MKIKQGFWSQAFMNLYQNKLGFFCAIFCIILIVAGLLAPWLTPYPYNEPHYYPYAYSGPTLKFIMGTDDLGRDLFSRLLYSLHNAILISIGATLLSVIVGGTLGALAGYVGGTLDFILMRITDIMFAFPSFLFSIVLVTSLGRGIPVMLLAVGVTSWVGMARLMRAQVLVVKNLEYVEMARVLGASHWRIITRYIIPNSLGPLIVSITFSIPGAMMVESGLSYLGMGVQPPIPSWGTLIAEGAGAIRYYQHLFIYPAASFALVLLAFTYLGDALQDALSGKKQS